MEDKCPKCNKAIDVDNLNKSEFMYEDVICPYCNTVIDVSYDEIEINREMVPVYLLKVKNEILWK